MAGQLVTSHVFIQELVLVWALAADWYGMMLTLGNPELVHPTRPIDLFDSRGNAVGRSPLVLVTRGALLTASSVLVARGNVASPTPE